MNPVGCFVHLPHGKTFCSQNYVLPKYLYVGIRRDIFPSSDSNLALSALTHCNSFRPVFCLTQHIICKWIFKDLHIYITEFLSLKFSKSAKFCSSMLISCLFPALGNIVVRNMFAVDSEVKHESSFQLYLAPTIVPNKCRFL